MILYNHKHKVLNTNQPTYTPNNLTPYYPSLDLSSGVWIMAGERVVLVVVVVELEAVV